LAAATAETFVEALVFLTPPVFAADVFELALVATACRREVVLATPCLVSCEAWTEEGRLAGLAEWSNTSLLDPLSVFSVSVGCRVEEGGRASSPLE
jgi:hypothetical protein